MNNIYLINEFNEFLIHLNFESNSFILNNIEYTFDLFEFDKIKIFWSENKIEDYSTKDSYLYFSNLELIDVVKKINLVHSDWHDQAVLNFRNNKLIRIKNEDQYGTFFLEENKNLIIDWNYWGKENYIYYDENVYYQEKYNIISYNLNNNIPVYIFIHICAIEDWKSIFKEMINSIKKSGLYTIVKKIKIGILGHISVLKDPILEDEKFTILYYDFRINLYEIHTINHIKYFCTNTEEKEIYILYLHTKGVRKAGNEKVIKSWREMMEYFLIEKYKDCLEYLHYFNTLGNNVVNSFIFEREKVSISKQHTLHYSGNFWWSKKSYIITLPFLNLDLTKESFKSRFQSENWILSNYEVNNNKFGIIFQDNTNTHPYHRFVFNNYINNKVIIKKIII